MKVCIIVNEYPPDRLAGTAAATQAIAKFLHAKRYRVFIIVTERAIGSPYVSDDGGIRVFRLPTGKLPIIRWFCRILKIRRILKSSRPVLLHGQAISCGLYALYAGLGLNIPVLTSIQGNDLYESSWFQKLTEVRWALRGSDKVITVNRELAGMGRELFGIPDIQVIHNGFSRENRIPDRKILRDKYGVDDNERILVCVARLIPSKGIDVLLKSIDGLNIAVKLWVIGDGKEKDKLVRMADRLGIKNQVLFLGSMEHRLVAERMKAADLFVLPSRSEPFGISLLEAMDAGLPIVATRVGGIPEIVSETNGILVPPEDPGALSLALSVLFGDSVRRDAMSKANIEKASRYQWDMIGEKYVEVYHEMMQSPKKWITRP